APRHLFKLLPRCQERIGGHRPLLAKENRYFEIGERRFFRPFLSCQNISKDIPSGGLDVGRHIVKLSPPASDVFVGRRNQLCPPKLDRRQARHSYIRRASESFECRK